MAVQLVWNAASVSVANAATASVAVQLVWNAASVSVANAANTIVAAQSKSPALSTLRWTGTWDSYVTPPQQMLDRQEVFSMLDPLGVFDFYMLMRGLMSAQDMFVSRRVLAATDPLYITPTTVNQALQNVGALVDEQQTFEQKAAMLRRHVPWMQSRGTAASIAEALTFLGYTGYALNVWVNPAQIGTTREYIFRPIGWFDVGIASSYVLSSGLAIVVNRQDVSGNFPLSLEDKQRIAKFLKLTVVPAHSYIRFFVGDAGVELDDTGVSSDSGAGVEGGPTLVTEGFPQATAATTAGTIVINP